MQNGRLGLGAIFNKSLHNFSRDGALEIRNSSLQKSLFCALKPYVNICICN